MNLNIKQVILFGAVFSLVFSLAAFSNEAAFGDHNSKSYICHKGKTMEVNSNALNGHFKHGDTDGKCSQKSSTAKSKVLTGDGPPPDELGEEGDLYFDSTNENALDYYLKIDYKVWEFRGTLLQPSNDCQNGDVLKYNLVDKKWECSVDLDTLASLSCSDNQIAQWNATSTTWDCADISSSDTLADLSCSDTQIAKWNSTAVKWECNDDLVDDTDIDPTNELQLLTRLGTDIILNPGGSNVSVNDTDANPTNELQTLSQSGTDVTLSQSGGTISINDLDANPDNELQVLSQTGSDVTLSNEGGTFSVNDNDSDPTNELQSIVISTKTSAEFTIPQQDSLSGSISCDNGIATGINILYVSDLGTPVFSEIIFNGATVDYTIFEVTSNDQVTIKVMLTCMQLFL